MMKFLHIPYNCAYLVVQYMITYHDGPGGPYVDGGRGTLPSISATILRCFWNLGDGGCSGS